MKPYEKNLIQFRKKNSVQFLVRRKQIWRDDEVEMKNSALPSPQFIFFGYGLPNLARLNMFPNDILSDRREQLILTEISQILQCPIESPWHSFPPFEGLFIQDQQKGKKEKRSLNLCSRTDTLTRLKAELICTLCIRIVIWSYEKPADLWNGRAQCKVAF